MSFFTQVFDYIKNGYSKEEMNTTFVISVLIVVALLSAYEFFVYRFVSHRAFYNKSFNISVAVLPFFIATIVLSLQSSLVITLGTIGALAIIRFRTSVKDPVDMVYLLWSVHTGIMCGCQLYGVALITSLAVTVVLFVLDYLKIGRRPYCLILHCDSDKEDEVLDVVEAAVKKFRVKSRNYTSKGMDFAIECSTKDPKALSDALTKETAVERFTIIEYDNEDIV
ncbi:MAG: DUF4956 domain-containing protein [Clostridia bacterium]|nr:DUF4956 domain-containing protein [Clostridia bacterium]